jgi:hypothetical protein
MTERDWQAYADAIDERPTYRRNTGRILSMETQAEFRSRQHPQRRARKRLATILLELDEQAVRMQQSDRNLRELGLL